MNEKCFALRPEKKCAITVCGVCNGNYNKCPFYKPKWMAVRDTKRCLYRISELKPETQIKIADKYYHGERIWERIRHELLAGAS